MRIAIDARYVADHFPGIGRYVYNLLRTLAEASHGHRILVIYNPSLVNRRFDVRGLASHAAIELIETSARPFGPLEHLQLPRLLRAIRADVFHAPYYVRPYVALPCPVVTTLYDVIPRTFPEESTPRARLLFDSLMKLAAQTSARLIAISEHARDDIAAAYGIQRDTIAVTYLAADERMTPQPPAEIVSVRARLGLPEEYALTLSSNKPHKNLPVLVEAWALFAAQHPAALLVVAGHWDDRYPQARQLAANLGLGERVRFLPSVPETDLPALYSGARAFVYPSRYEGFGLPPLEAMACGTPVICGAVSSLPEVVGSAALTADPSSPRALATALTQLWDNAALQRDLRTRGRAQASWFSWRRTAAQTLAIYEDAARS